MDLATNYSDFIAGNTSNKDVLAFSTGDDVIDYLLTGDLEFGKCGGSASFNKIEDVDDAHGYAMFRFNARYFKAGIYNTVYVKARHFYVGTPNNLSWYDENLFFEVHVDTHWKSLRVQRRPCNSSSKYYHHGGIRSFTEFSHFSGSTPSISRVFRAYEKVRALNGYRVWVRGRVTVNGILFMTPWFGRIVNANF